MDQVFIMSSTICSLHSFDGICVKRRLNTNKSMSIHWIALIWLAVVPWQQYAVHGLDELHIGGIFPIGGKGGWQGGQACQPAAELALEDVNRNSDLLPGFKLTLYSNDSEVCTIFQSFFIFSLCFLLQFFAYFIHNFSLTGIFLLFHQF